VKTGRNVPCPCGSGKKHKKCCLNREIPKKPPRVLLLFGAGASYGAGGVTPETPPLGFELYERLAKCFPATWGQFQRALDDPSKEIHALFSTGSFEKGMLLLRDSRSDYVYFWNDAAIYFSRFRIGDRAGNAYCQLIDRYYRYVQLNQIALSTLNYECLLEHSIMRHHPQITYWGDGPGIRVLKVHGSCNFVPAINIQGTSKVHLTWPARSLIPIEPFGNIDDIEQHISAHNVKRGIPVAMSLYTEGKDNIGGIEELGQIVTAFQECIRAARLVIVIGVRPNPDDQHIWEHLRSMRGMLQIVGDKEECEVWAAKHRSGEAGIWMASTFTESLPLVFERIDQALRGDC